MRYRYNNAYDIVDNKKSENISLDELKKVIKNLVPSFEDKSEKNDEKIDEIEILAKKNSRKIDVYNDDREDLLKIVDQKIATLNERVNNLVSSRNDIKNNNKNIELLMDELISFKERQSLFNDTLCDKIDDRIDRINELINFINSIKEKIDKSSANGANDSNYDLINNKINDFITNFTQINERLAYLEKQISEKENKKLDKIIDLVNEEKAKDANPNSNFDNEIAKLDELIKEQKEENKTSSSNSDDNYNKNWLKEFEEMQLSLEDDGIYEYDVDNMEEDEMKFEYYNGELPKTKIVKVKSNNLVKNYSNDEINSFIGEEARKLASKEIDKLMSDSEVTQKAWLANNQRLNEMASIIERQEEEIKRLNLLNKIGEYSDEDIISMVKMEALKLVRNEYEQRIQNLENNKNVVVSNDDRLSTLQKQLEEERLENLRLKAILNNKEQPKTEPVIVNVTNSVPDQPIKATIGSSPAIAGQQRRKRKQKFFFEIKEHDTPKITRADIDKESKK